MFEIVFVCTGNRCRSPYAQIRLSGLSPDWVAVSSAGTLDIPGARPPKELRQVASDRSVDMSAYRSRSLRDVDANRVDLVLGMTLDHVARAVVDRGAEASKSFTLTEFVRLVEAFEDASGESLESARDLVARAHEQRFSSNVFVPADDVEDPMGGPVRAYVEMADKVDNLCDRLAGCFGWR